MKLDSKFFDRLRVKPDAARLVRDACPTCEWKGCAEPGLYPAPKGRAREGEYHRFCLDHVRQYNKGYNYFAGMPDEDVARHQKDDVIGHRPTWFVGVNSSARKRAAYAHERRNGFSWRFATQDPFGLFGSGQTSESKPNGEPPRPLRRAERKCLRQLSLEEGATKAEIKARFKDLVKRHHPDLNRGDRRSEDKLREVIQAYNYLRQAGLA
jgi:DnaJ-domain-containing protein 1